METDKNALQLNIYWMITIVAMGGLLFGYGTAIISGAIIFISQTYHLQAFDIEMMISAILLGAVIGALAIGKISDLYGRRDTLIVASLCFIIGSLLCTLGHQVLMMMIGRFIVGLAIGISSFSVPLYIAEIAPENRRGSLVIINTLTVTGGMVIAYIINYVLSFSQAWRWMFALGIIPAVFMGLGLCYLPRSPQRFNSDEKKKWRDLIDPSLKPVFILGIGLAMIQQIGGINVIFYYAPHIFQLAGFNNISVQLLSTIGLGITNFMGTLLAFWLVDKLGRRQLLTIGLSSMIVSLALVALTLQFSNHLFSHLITLLSLIIYIAAYALSIGCLFWLIASEIFPLNIRGKAMSIVTAINWIINLLLSLTFLNLIQAIGIANTFWMYTLFNFLSLLFCYYLVPETKGVSLEQIEENLRMGKPSRELGLPLTFT